MEEKLNIPTQEDLIKIPTDETKDAVIVNLEVTTWLEITKDETKKANLRSPDGKVLIVKYDVGGLIRNEIFPFGSSSTTHSKYGKFLTKYNTNNAEDFVPYVGMKLKVLFDGEGRSDILIK